MKRNRILSAALGSALLLPVPVWAAEGKAALPQLDASLFPGQLFWLAITFPLLYILLSRLALPVIQRTQDKRRKALKTDLNAAAKANEKAQAMREGYEKAWADARAKAHVTVTEIATTVAKEAEEKQTAQQAVLNKRIADAEAKIAAVRDAALKDAQTAAADLAKAVVTKITDLKAGAA
ncbi:MAG: hypothetical protein HGA90_07450 [Alphaproteobacteria bacterium]|nr:hypothetical protein [Alphaproteobacteria bacterium]